MKYARISGDGLVLEVFTTPAGFELNECFTAEIASQFEPCPDDVEANATKNPDGTFTPEPPIEIAVDPQEPNPS